MAAAVSRLIFSCFILSGTPPPPAQVDYCTTSFCPAGVKNVGCEPPPLTGGLGCAGKNAAVFEIGPEDQDTFLFRLNEIRNIFASGVYGLFGYPSAVRMPMLKWDAELASQAGHKARTCEYTKDACRNTAKYSNVGQVITQSSKVYDFTIVKKSDVLIELANSATLQSFIQSASPYDFGNLIYDKADAVGCALQQYDGTANGPYKYYLVCNLSAASIVGQPLYATGPVGSGCKSGRDEAHSSLCSSAEVI